MKSWNLLESIHALDDEQFDRVYPPEVRALSSIHWTPVNVARRAAAFLVREPGTRVLDLGCGPGKFCIVGAITTSGRFFGVEQRPHLCDLARTAIAEAGIQNAGIFHGNITDIKFSRFNAFYLFNPFAENLEPTLRIDASIPLDSALYAKYTTHVAGKLARAPLGTRVATYCVGSEAVPMGYQSLESSTDYGLDLWEKTEHLPMGSPSGNRHALIRKQRRPSDRVRADAMR